MGYFQNKWHDLAVLFRDRELRILSPLSFILLILLISVKYISDQTYIFAITVGSFWLLAYLFQFLLLYDIYFLTVRKLKKGIGWTFCPYSIWAH